MNSKALVLAAVTTGVAVVTLVALNLIAPISHAEEHGKVEGVTADQVFAASIAEPGASAPASQPMEVAALADTAAPAAEAAPAAAAAPESAPAEPTAPAAAPSSPAPSQAAVGGGSCAMGVAGGTPVVVPAAGAPASSEPAPAMEVAQVTPEAAPAPEPAPAPAESAPAPTESAPPLAPMEPMADAGAGSPPPASPAPSPMEAGGACSTGLADPNAAPVVVKAQGYPGDTSAPAAPTDLASAENQDASAAMTAETPVEAAPPPPAPEAAPAPEPAPAPAPEPAAPAPEPAPAAAPPPPAPEPKAETPKPAPKPKAESKPKEPKEPKPAKAAPPKKAPAEAKVAWWPAKSAGKLNVTYAGEANFTKAIVILFDGQFDNPESANQNIKVKAKNGGAVPSKWLVAKGNPSMLLLDVDPGLYTVEVGTGLVDKGGRTIGAASKGAVFVH